MVRTVPTGSSDVMWRPPSRRLWVQNMREGETMEEVMNQELNEAIATLNRANRALSRIFGIEEEGEGESND